jgi:hypothetical protein
MADDLTPWEEINPPMGSARLPAPQSQCSGRLQPATSDDFRNELAACLTLVAPVGMTEEAKRDWLAVAWATIGHLPADLLSLGCKQARQTCDHPSKIVPAIIAATEQSLHWRASLPSAATDAPRLPKPDYVKPEEAAEILKEFGLKRTG